MSEVVKKFEAMNDDEKLDYFLNCNPDELEALISSGVYNEIADRL